MADPDWQDVDDDALERMLIERWLYRGLLLGIMLLAAIVTTWLGVRGVVSVADRVTVGALLALALAAAVMGFAMRRQDLRIHRELRRRRRGSSEAAPPP